MRFAFITDELPRPGQAGHLAMNSAIISWLHTQGHEVTVFLTRSRLRTPCERYELARVEGFGVGVWRGLVFDNSIIGNLRIVARWWRRLITNNQRKPRWLPAFLSKKFVVDAWLGSFCTAAQTAWCAGRVAKYAPDAVLVDTIFRAAVLNAPALAGLRSVIIAHDVFYKRHQAFAAAGYSVRPEILTREMEARLLNAAHIVAAIQPDEAALIGKLCPARIVCTMPMPAQICVRPPGMVRQADHLVFVGSDSLPNLDGLRWFFEDIWPRLRIWRTSLTLDLVGDCANAFSILPEGVNKIGRIKHLAPILHRASLAIAPLRVATGLNIKLLDYARHGLYTIATPACLQGLAADRFFPFVSAADANLFTNAVARRLNGLAQADEWRAEQYIERHYGLENSFAGFAAALKLPDKLSALP